MVVCDVYFNVLMKIIEAMFTLGKTKNFCSVLVTYVVVGNYTKMNSIIYLKFLIGVFNKPAFKYSVGLVQQVLKRNPVVLMGCIQKAKLGNLVQTG